MFRFTIRDVLWLTVVVGLGLAVSVERYHSAKLRSELRESAHKVWECEDRFAELAITLQDYSPGATLRITDGQIEITKEGSWSSSTKRLRSGEARQVRVYQATRDDTKRQAMAYKQAREANEAKLKTAEEPTKEKLSSEAALKTP